jgi:hypothetical protein
VLEPSWSLRHSRAREGAERCGVAGGSKGQQLPTEVWQRGKTGDERGAAVLAKVHQRAAAAAATARAPS